VAKVRRELDLGFVTGGINCLQLAAAVDALTAACGTAFINTEGADVPDAAAGAVACPLQGRRLAV
jgi:hypothetical protein